MRLRTAEILAIIISARDIYSKGVKVFLFWVAHRRWQTMRINEALMSLTVSVSISIANKKYAT